MIKRWNHEKDIATRNIYTYIYVYICIYMDVCICMYVCMYIHIEPPKKYKAKTDRIKDTENASVVLVCWVASDSLQPHGLYIAHKSPLSIGFSRQEYWSGLSFPLSRNLPKAGIKLVSSVSPALAGGIFTTVPPGKPLIYSSWKL